MKKKNNSCPSSDCKFFSLKESEKNGINCYYLHEVCSAFGKVGSLCFSRIPESYYFDFLAGDDGRKTSPNQLGDMLFSPIFSVHAPPSQEGRFQMIPFSVSSSCNCSLVVPSLAFFKISIFNR